MVIALVLLLALQVPAPAGGPSPLAEGVLADVSTGAPRLIEYVVWPDSTVTLRDLGALPAELGPTSGFPELPDADSLATVRLSADVLRTMVASVDETLGVAPPADRLSYSYDDEGIRVGFERGLSLGGVALLLVGLVGAAVGGTAWVAVRRARRRRGADLAARRRRLEATEAERTRLAREIHDGPLQDLHAIRAHIAIEQMRRAPADGDAVADDVSAVATELRAIAEGLRPPALGRFGLPAALAGHARRVRQRHPGVHVVVAADDDVPPLTEPAQTALFRIAQEAVANAVRHGGATRVEVVYEAVPNAAAPRHVRLSVADDGAGLPAAVVADAGAVVADGHFGLAGIRERVALLGGTLRLVPDGGRALAGGGGPGATVDVTLPWAVAARPSDPP